MELACARCLGRFPVGPRFGCPTCREQGRAEPLELRVELGQLGGAPDAVVVPVGAGDGLYGIAKGFVELADDALIVDLASAASVAGAAELARRGLVQPKGRVVALLTASGARWPRPAGYATSGRVLRCTAADVRRLVG